MRSIIFMDYAELCINPLTIYIMSSLEYQPRNIDKIAKYFTVVSLQKVSFYSTVRDRSRDGNMGNFRGAIIYTLLA